MSSGKATLYVCLLTGLAMVLAVARPSSGQNSSTAIEAPSGYDNQPNGLTDAATFAMDRGKFEEVEAIGDGLGPTFNAQSCRECHQNPVSGSTSQVKELRAGHRGSAGNFVPATATLADGTITIANRSLINQRAICPAVDSITVNGQSQTFNFPQTQAQERISTAETIRAFRISLNTLGDGFIEAIADQTLRNLASNQCRSTGGAICGEAVEVPVLEANGAPAVGRFGWKDQHASLLSFSSDAYLNEMGISNRLPPIMSTSRVFATWFLTPTTTRPMRRAWKTSTTSRASCALRKCRPETRPWRALPMAWPGRSFSIALAVTCATCPRSSLRLRAPP